MIVSRISKYSFLFLGSILKPLFFAHDSPQIITFFPCEVSSIAVLVEYTIKFSVRLNKSYVEISSSGRIKKIFFGKKFMFFNISSKIFCLEGTDPFISAG